MKLITVSIPDDLYVRLEKEAATKNLSIEELVTQRFDVFSDDEPKRKERERRLDELFALQDSKSADRGVGSFDREEIYKRHLL